VHRDLKLGNMVLNTRTRRVTITNFCLGKHLIGDRDLLRDQRGSPAYISPDVLSGMLDIASTGRHVLPLVYVGVREPLTTSYGLGLTGLMAYQEPLHVPLPHDNDIIYIEKVTPHRA